MMNLTYTQLFKRYQGDIQQAIAQYQAFFEEEAMPEHRAVDIAEFYEALADSKDDKSLSSDIRYTVDNLKTGLFWGDWHLYETGESRLKNKVNAVLDHPDYQAQAFMKARIYELENEALAQSNQSDISLSLFDVNSGLADELAKLRQKVSSLEASVLKKDERIQQLEANNQSLTRRNYALAGKNQEVRKKLELAAKGVKPTSDDDYLSPTDEINQNFTNFQNTF